jgi:hypothetical protein
VQQLLALEQELDRLASEIAQAWRHVETARAKPPPRVAAVQVRA